MYTKNCYRFDALFLVCSLLIFQEKFFYFYEMKIYWRSLLTFQPFFAKKNDEFNFSFINKRKYFSTLVYLKIEIYFYFSRTHLSNGIIEFIKTFLQSSKLFKPWKPSENFPSRKAHLSEKIDSFFKHPKKNKVLLSNCVPSGGKYFTGSPVARLGFTIFHSKFIPTRFIPASRFRSIYFLSGNFLIWRRAGLFRLVSSFSFPPTSSMVMKFSKDYKFFWKHSVWIRLQKFCLIYSFLELHSLR